MGQLAEAVLSLSGWAAVAVLFVLPALEAPAFLGLVLPGEVALLLGGVLAHQGRLSPWPPARPARWPETRPATGSAAAGARACWRPASAAGSVRAACNGSSP